MKARTGVGLAPRSRLGRAARGRGRPDGRSRRLLGLGRAHAMARLLVLAPPRLDPREVALVHVAPLLVSGGGKGSGLPRRKLQHPHPRHATLRSQHPTVANEGEVSGTAGDEAKRRGHARSFLPSSALVASPTSQRPHHTRYGTNHPAPHRCGQASGPRRCVRRVSRLQQQSERAMPPAGAGTGGSASAGAGTARGRRRSQEMPTQRRVASSRRADENAKRMVGEQPEVGDEER